MPTFSTPAIMLRRIEFGDYDIIITFFTLNQGKVSVIAKSAKKSTKRFSGILELFSVLDIVYGSARGKGLPVLKEAMLKQPFLKIRADIKKTAYASYWAELINEWMEKGEKQIKLYHLLKYVLGELDFDHTPEAVLSILFQMRFMSISGHSPNLRQCSVCKTPLEGIKKAKIIFDLARGGLVCHNCSQNFSGRIALSKGTIKQLLWIEKQDLIKAKRIRFTPQASMEGLKFLEAFVPYHLGKEPRSLKFLRQIRV
ncbi:MAG: DNA repair protein RecO [Thermodesulfobacteriota bacterium]|nr:DNA repair protein RecO [Thermodesulfobacteriota bacterium]